MVSGWPQIDLLGSNCRLYARSGCVLVPDNGSPMGTVWLGGDFEMSDCSTQEGALAGSSVEAGTAARDIVNAKLFSIQEPHGQTCQGMQNQKPGIGRWQWVCREQRENKPTI